MMELQSTVHSWATPQKMVMQCIVELVLYANLMQIQPMVQRFLLFLYL